MTDKQESRLQVYLGHVRQLKEKKALNQIAETEVLQFVIPTCIELIDECPTTEVGQQGIINMICLRATLHGEHEQIKKKIASFLFSINTYLKESAEHDNQASQDMLAEIFNTEAVLIKIIQAVIYCSGLFMDNLMLGISRFRGSEAELQLHELAQKIELGREFWKQFYHQFVQDSCKKIYEEIITEKQFAMTREQSAIVIRFPVSQYFQTEKNQEQGVLSRIQNRYVQTKSETGTDCLRLLRQCAKIIKRPEIETGEYEDLCARMLAMDGLGETCVKLFQPDNPPQSSEELTNWIFHLEQAEYMLLMTRIAMDTIWSELTSIFSYPPEQMQTLRLLTRNLAPQRADSLWPFLFLCEFEEQIRYKADEDLKKISLRRLQERKIPVDLLKRMLKAGLAKEQQKQLVALHPKTKTFSFKPQQRDELQKILVHIADKELRELLLQAWDESSSLPDILLLLHLKALARGTTNLSQKITQLLGRFGIKLGK